MTSDYRKLRLYHAMLASSALAAYATGESGVVHAWVGYAVLGIIMFRFVWGLFGPRQFRIGRFLPALSSLLRIRAANDPAIARVLLGGVVASLLLVVGTGVALDTLRVSNMVAAARAVPAPRVDLRARVDSASVAAIGNRTNEGGSGGSERWLRELHGFSASMMPLLVGLHVSYVLVFRRLLAMFMLFRPAQKQEVV